MNSKLTTLKAPTAGPCPRGVAAGWRVRAGLAGIAVAGIALGGLAGCGSISNAAGSVGLPVQDWSDVHAKREPKPALVELRHTVGFTGTGSGLDRGEADRLRAFLAGADLGYGDKVYVVATRPEGVQPSNAAWLAGRRADAVADFLARERIGATVSQAAGGPGGSEGDVTVYVRRYVAVLPACPDWSGVPGIDFNNQPSSNWGCATAMNFGMMLADPGDLVRGRDPGYADGEYSARAVEAYRQGKAKDLIRDASAGEIFPDSGKSSGGQ